MSPAEEFLNDFPLPEYVENISKIEDLSINDPSTFIATVDFTSPEDAGDVKEDIQESCVEIGFSLIDGVSSFLPSSRHICRGQYGNKSFRLDLKTFCENNTCTYTLVAFQ